MSWLIADTIIVIAYGLQHSLLTTKTLVAAYNRVFPSYTWNIVYSLFSIFTLLAGFYFWEPSGVYLFSLVPGSWGYHFMLIGLSASLFFFLYFFKYTTSFWQWLGIKQVAYRIIDKEQPAYYRVRKHGIKQYIRFPHHTCLIFFFWLHPVMTLDTLFLAISATAYLYLGTYHQDLRGLRLIGAEWSEYRKDTCLLLPGPKVIRRIKEDIKNIINPNSMQN